MYGFTILMIATEQIWCDIYRGFKRQAQRTRRENLWFCVAKQNENVKRSWDFNYSSLLYNIIWISLHVLTAVVA